MKSRSSQLLRNTVITAVSLLAALSMGVNAQSDQASEAENILATVNGRPITQKAVDAIEQQLSADDPQTDSQGILEELINLEVLTQAAEELNLDLEPDISTTLQLQYTQTMANAYLARKSEEMSFTDEQLRAEYALQTANAERSEYRAAHILLETAEQATAVLTELDEGKPFADAAAEHSIDSSAENGGDLGWFAGSTMVVEFAEAVAEMEPGDVSSAAVQSDFGFHIIRLDEKRDAALPDFESVKSGLTNLAVRRALSEHVEELKDLAEIKTQ